MTDIKDKKPAGEILRANKDTVPSKRRAPRAAVRMTKKVAEEIVERMCDGESLKAICEDPHIPTYKAIFKFMHFNQTNPELRDSFAAAYKMAQQVRAEVWADEIISIADSAEVDRDAVAKARLQVDSRKWLVSKMLPAFADKGVSVGINAGTGSGDKGGDNNAVKVSIYLPDNNRENNVNGDS